MSARAASPLAYLEQQQNGRSARRIILQQFPFRIGRSLRADHTIHSAEVSTLHAEVRQEGEALVLQDLGSTNGTFVNARRIVCQALRDGDIVHFASEEHRFGLAAAPDLDEVDPTMEWTEGATRRNIREPHDLERIFAQRAVQAAFQPIVRLADGARVAYEALGRVTIAEGRYSIGDTLRIAGERGQAGRLSRLSREVALADVPRLPERPVSIFLNLHPAEMTDLDELAGEVDAIVAALDAGQHAVLEIHEGAVTDQGTMRTIAARLRAAGVGLAYDDFGAGQSRLMELVEVPPDFLKLDMALVRDIDRSPRRQDLVRALVSVIRELGIEVIAEGLERQDEADVCRQLGCLLGQGYLLGRPAPLAR